jgi:zinc transporter ZupT
MLTGFAVLVFIVTWLAGLPPFRHQHRKRIGVDYSTGEALACGIFLGAALLHMLPEANEAFHDLGYHYPFAFVGAGIVFLLLLWLEHLGTHLADHHNSNSPAYAWLSTVVLSIHSVLAGAALGSTDQLSTAIIIMVAVIAHKWAASFALAVKLVQSGKPLQSNLVAFGLFSSAFPIGIVAGAIAADASSGTTAQWLVPSFNAFAAGTFLYLGTLHGLTRATLINRCCNRRDFNFVIIGFVLMALVAIVH